MVRVCRKCGIPKEMDERRRVCEDCVKQRVKAANKAYYLANKESENTRSKKYKAEHRDRIKEYNEQVYQESRLDPEKVEKQRARCRNYGARNKDMLNEKARQYREEHLEQVRETNREYSRRTMAVRRCYKADWKRKKWASLTGEERERALLAKRIEQHKRNVRTQENGGVFTQDEWIMLCQSFDNRCLRCLVQTTLVVDHVTPISKGGRNSIENLQPLCLSCNSIKRSKDTDYRQSFWARLAAKILMFVIFGSGIRRSR